MGKYYNSINDKLKNYFNILEKEFPEWLEEYIDVYEMQRLKYISYDCGGEYTNLFENHNWHSCLDHSIGVALIIWHFTKSKKQTLAGLFHDIATPVFRHCIDFMMGDYENQESTEDKTENIIRNSKAITSLLKRDNIKIEEIINYKLYPIADNDTPKLAADRLEYNFCCGYLMYPIWKIDDLSECYNDITILKNEDGIDELGFKHIDIASKYISIVKDLWPVWINNECRITMQFLADICKVMSKRGYLTIKDLYTLKEEEVVSKIKNCKDKDIKEAFKNFQKATKVYESSQLLEDKYSINVKTKRRYINPLVQNNNKVNRVYDCSKTAKKYIDEYLKLKIEGNIYLDFYFKV